MNNPTIIYMNLVCELCTLKFGECMIHMYDMYDSIWRYNTSVGILGISGRRISINKVGFPWSKIQSPQDRSRSGEGGHRKGTTQLLKQTRNTCNVWMYKTLRVELCNASYLLLAENFHADFFMLRCFATPETLLPFRMGLPISLGDTCQCPCWPDLEL